MRGPITRSLEKGWIDLGLSGTVDSQILNETDQGELRSEARWYGGIAVCMTADTIVLAKLGVEKFSEGVSLIEKEPLQAVASEVTAIGATSAAALFAMVGVECAGWAWSSRKRLKSLRNST